MYASSAPRDPRATGSATIRLNPLNVCARDRQSSIHSRIGLRSLERRQHEQPARSGMRIALVRSPHVRDHRKSTAPIDAEPGPAGFLVAPCQQRNRLAPPGGRSGTASVELIPVGRDDQRILRVSLPREQDQAHRGRAFHPERQSAYFRKYRRCGIVERPYRSGGRIDHRVRQLARAHAGRLSCAEP